MSLSINFHNIIYIMKYNDYFNIAKFLFIFISIVIIINLFDRQLFKEYEKSGNILFLIGGIVILFFISKAGLWI